MKTLNNEIFVQRGETFSIDRLIENKDTSPFVISSEIGNPYFLLTVSNARYEQEQRYVYRKWVNLDDFLKFKQSQIVELKTLKSDATGSYVMYRSFTDSKFNSLQSYTDPVSGVTYNNLVAYGYVNGELILFEVGDAVFTDGTSYKYWDSNKEGNGWTDYTCRFAVMFSTKITKDWVEQNYLYSINLVGGTSTIEYLRDECDRNELIYTNEMDASDLANLLKDNNVEVTVNINKPLVDIDFNIPLLKPTKLTVSSDLNGGEA